MECGVIRRFGIAHRPQIGGEIGSPPHVPASLLRGLGRRVCDPVHRSGEPGPGSGISDHRQAVCAETEAAVETEAG